MEAVAEKEVSGFCVSKKLSFQQKCIEKREWSNVMQRLSSWGEKASFSKSKKHSRRRPYLEASRRPHWSCKKTDFEGHLGFEQ